MNEATLLLRQVHPSFLQDGRASSQVFRPTPKDEQRLSVYDGDLISPHAAYVHYTERLGHLSSGVLAVIRAECEELELPVIPDPKEFPEHALIDFSGHSKSATERKAKQLRARALARGWQYRAMPA